MISLKIDGKRCSGEAGEMILDVARREGIEIPSLCSDTRLAPFDSCGVCVVEVDGRGVVKSCSTPIAEEMSVATRSPAAEDVRRAALELLLSNHWGDCIAPCQQECPAHTDCQAYVSLAGNGAFLDGLKILYERLPLPACFGRICPAPCEDACRREVAEEPVQIRHIKRFLGDHGFDYVPPVAAETGKRVAVVGGGPAGLSVAYFLRRRGHGVVVYEAMPRMGGMLRYGIPEYRLPQSVIDREVNVLERMGIDFRNGIRLGEDVGLDELRADHDAVFLGLGAWGTRSLGISGEEHPAVMQGTDFLRRVNEGDRPDLPRRVVVIGGGDTAMDAARCARRLGAEVKVLYRRTAEEMPAREHEVAEVRGEGVTFQYLTQPVALSTDGESLRGVTCVRMELGEPGEDGRRRPVPIEGSEFLEQTDLVLVAVGQTVDARCLEDTAVTVDRRGRVVIEDETGRTSVPDVFAGGDVVTGPDIAVRAVAGAHRAADAIDRSLRGSSAVSGPTYVHVKQGVTRGDLGNPARSPRIRTPVRPVEERLADFEEYESVLSDEDAIAAGQRCLECGCMTFNDCALRDVSAAVGARQETYAGDVPHKRRDERHPFIVRKVGKCISCGRCVRVCADVCGVAAIDFAGRGIDAEVQAPFNRAWQDSACVSCGACVDTCPTGALYDRSVLEKQVPLDLDGVTTTCMLCGLGCEIRVLTLNGAYMRTVPADGQSVLCARGRYGWHALSTARRIVRPMIRRGSSLVEVSWDEAEQEAARLIGSVQGSANVFGTGLLTDEEGWIVSRIAAQMGGNAPTFDVAASPPTIAIDKERLATIEDLHSADLIVYIGGTGSCERVAIHAILRRAMREGTRLVSIGSGVPDATVELDPAELPALLKSLDEGAVASTAAGSVASWAASARTPLILIEERTIGEIVLQEVAELLSRRPTWRLVAIPATVNAIGLRRLGFSEEFRVAPRVWLTVGADPIALPAGRQRLLGVDVLIAVSPIANATTERAHVVFPMRLPYETRGHVSSGRGRTSVPMAVEGPLELESWEVLLRLADAIGCGPLARTYDAVVREANLAREQRGTSATAAGTTPAGIAGAIDRRLSDFGV